MAETATAAEPPEAGRIQDAYRRRAIEKYAWYSDHDVEIDEVATVFANEEGAFVAAWLWIGRDELEEGDA